MKKIFLGFVCVLGVFVTNVSRGQNVDPVDTAVAVAVDKFMDVRLNHLETSEQVQLLTDIIGAIDVLKQQNRYTTDTLYATVLDSLRVALNRLLDAIDIDNTNTTGITDDVTDTHNNGNEDTITVHTDSYEKHITTYYTFNDLPVLILGGEVSDAITKFRMTAAGEDIIIKELTLTINGSSDAYHALESIALYDDEGNFITEKRVTGNDVTFDGLDILVPIGSYDIYPVLKTRKIGYGYAGVAGAQFTLTLRIDDTEGTHSHKKVGVSNNYISSKEVVVVPTLINITMNTYDDTLFLAQSDIAKFTVSAIDSDNTRSDNPGSDIDTLLRQLQFRLFSNNIDETNPPHFYLERSQAINSSNNKLEGVRDQTNNKLTFDLAPRANDNAIIDGDVNFTVSVEGIHEINADTSTTIQLILEAGNENAVIFETDDASYGQFSLPLNQDLEGGRKRKD